MNNKFIISAVVAVVAVFSAMAQTSTYTPYSRFGYGIMSEQSNTMQKGMGGVGVAMRSGRQINFMNPASYAAIDTLTFLFDTGANIRTISTREGDNKGHDLSGGLDYIALQFPVTKYGAMSVGMMPYSEVGYSFGEEIVNGENSRQGSGAINQLYVGLSAKLFKGLTFGVNFNYMFGTTVNSSYITTDNGSTSLFERETEIRDVNFRFGLQYGVSIASDNYLTIGATFTPGKSFHGTARSIKYDVSLSETPDTLADVSLKGRAEMAPTYAFGINYQIGTRWMIEADYTYQPWKGRKYVRLEGFDADATTSTVGDFNDLWRVSAGVQYTPRFRGSYFQRINYRWGAYYQNDYIKVGDNSVRERGVTFGLGLPTPSSKSVVNLSVDYRIRRAHPTALVKENYWVITLGVNFNELWFWRNKIR